MKLSSVLSSGTLNKKALHDLYKLKWPCGLIFQKLKGKISAFNIE
jgi:hypothetical protein